MEAKLFSDVMELRRHHLMSLLNNYDEHCRESDKKSDALRVAQWALVVAASCLVVLLVMASVTSPHDVGMAGR
jgi:hypothetical protein